MTFCLSLVKTMSACVFRGKSHELLFGAAVECLQRGAAVMERPWGGLTCMGPVVVLHGGQVEEGVVAGRPGTLVRLLPVVQFLVVVQSPFFTEGALAQVTLVLPGGTEEERC